jgi:hypothetical protein
MSSPTANPLYRLLFADAAIPQNPVRAGTLIPPSACLPQNLNLNPTQEIVRSLESKPSHLKIGRACASLPVLRP